MVFGSVALDAVVSLRSNLALLEGTLVSIPYGLVIVDAVMKGFLVPIGLFLVLCGIALHLRSTRPPGRTLALRAALGGAGLNLAAGLLLGVVTFSLDLLPPEIYTVEFLRDLFLVFFAGTVAAAAGLLIAFCGMAALARSPHVNAIPPGKSIYRGVPSAR